MSMMIIPTFFKSLRLGYQYKKFKRWSCNKNREKCTTHQSQLEEYYEGVPLYLQRNYPVMLKVIYMASFYHTIMPICLIWAFLTLFLLYWIEKYNLLRRCTIKC